MGHLIVRTRRATDLDRCVEALRAVHHADAYPLNWPADPHGWLTPPRLLRAWIVDGPGGAVAGHVAVQRLPGTPDSPAPARHAELSRLYVTPAARRQSVASALVSHVRSWAAERGYDLTLNVTDDRRSAAVAFYEASGWQHSHTTDADWTTPDRRPVRLRHYILDRRDT
ncbi:Acetyltransferase (GNAT) family protein [Micromonospora pallida]|uniref:Acetyltransferase (GNAT) family protein n=1 Tax=Micromonospora pallida TaxID=145854 RepID=A0A1C6SRK6_9ACTN|nr:GNAT family N-acetyltransferase [Micromonospora pallida]SCL31745.1 Acetyltransferase (GNAT) family protein [Micromonospora pallida]